MRKIVEKSSQIGQKLPRVPLGRGARVGESEKKSGEGGLGRGEKKEK
jgi:hypothetical protein